MHGGACGEEPVGGSGRQNRLARASGGKKYAKNAAVTEIYEIFGAWFLRFGGACVPRHYRSKYPYILYGQRQRRRRGDDTKLRHRLTETPLVGR